MKIDLGRPFFVGICGGSASGKTSIAKVLNKFAGSENCLLFSMDNYYKGPTPEERKRLNEYNFDCPYALDLDLLFQHLRDLMDNKEIDMPIYEFNGSYRKEETTRVAPKKIIIFEGILAFHDKRIRDLMDIKIFVSLDPDLRLSRRIERDIADRGRELSTVIERYHKFVKPAFDTYIKPTIKYADLVIPRGAENSIATDLVAQFLRVYLEKRMEIIKSQGEQKKEEKVEEKVEEKKE